MIRVFNEFEQNFKFPRNIKIYLDKINKTANLYFSNCLIYIYISGNVVENRRRQSGEARLRELILLLFR